MPRNIRIINLIKRFDLYTNDRLEQAVREFNHQQNHLQISLDNYDLDSFILELENNQVKLGYLHHASDREYFEHQEDFLRKQALSKAYLTKPEAALVEEISPQNTDFILSRFGPWFNHNGLAVLNQAQALQLNLANTPASISNCRDKFQAYLQVRDLTPLVDSSFIQWQEAKFLPAKYLEFPRVTKPNSHSTGGDGINTAFNQAELIRQSYDLQPYDFVLSQDFIRCDGKPFDLRVMVINGEVAGAFLRVATEHKLVANIAKGAYAISYQLEADLEKQALAIAERLGLAITGLDFIYNPKTQHWCFLEANACPGFFAFDQVLQQDFARQLLDYAVLRSTGNDLQYFCQQELSEAELATLAPLDQQQAYQRKQELRQYHQEQQELAVTSSLRLELLQELQKFLLQQPKNEQVLYQKLSEVSKAKLSSFGIELPLEPELRKQLFSGDTNLAAWQPVYPATFTPFVMVNQSERSLEPEDSAKGEYVPEIYHLERLLADLVKRRQRLLQPEVNAGIRAVVFATNPEAVATRNKVASKTYEFADLETLLQTNGFSPEDYLLRKKEKKEAVIAKTEPKLVVPKLTSKLAPLASNAQLFRTLVLNSELHYQDKASEQVEEAVTEDKFPRVKINPSFIVKAVAAEITKREEEARKATEAEV